MSRPRIWVSQPLFADIVERLSAHADVHAQDRLAEHDALAIQAALHEADGALVTLNERIGAAEIAGAQRLRAIANVGVGYNNLDIAALDAAGIVATNTPDVLDETTADFAWALLLAAARRVGEAERWLRAGEWQRWSFDRLLGADLHGTTLGILGMGRIGQAIARRARGFGMRVTYHNRQRLPAEIERECAATWLPFDELFTQADHLVLALPYSTAVHHIVDAAVLARMKPTAVLVNIARGGIVDDAALAVALRERRLAAAGLDVFEGEPALNPALLECANAVLTPHIASASARTRRAMVSLAVDNLLAALGLGAQAGRPPNRIDAAGH